MKTVFKTGRLPQLRRRKIINSITMSLLLSKKVIDILSEKTKNSKNKNMSEIIENIVLQFLNKNKKLTIKRKPSHTFPIKKTFTFSPDFNKLLREKTDNYSSFIDTVLQKYFNIK